MFKTTAVLSVLSGLLLVAACGRPAVQKPHDGSVEFALGNSAVGAEEAIAGRLTITGLDRSFRTHVELPSSFPSRNVRVELAPGLYAIDAAASSSENEPVIPALSAPQLVVVAAGRVSTVNVLIVDAEAPAVAVLDAALQR